MADVAKLLSHINGANVKNSALLAILQVLTLYDEFVGVYGGQMEDCAELHGAYQMDFDGLLRVLD